MLLQANIAQPSARDPVVGMMKRHSRLANLALVLGWQLDPAGTGEGVDIPELERLGPQRCRVRVEVAFEYSEFLLRPPAAERRRRVGYSFTHRTAAG